MWSHPSRPPAVEQVTVRHEGVLARAQGPSQDAAIKWVKLAAGKEQVVFEQPLDEILLRQRLRGAPWYWEWPLRPAPPPSPLFSRRGGFVKEIPFTARVTAGAAMHSSPRVALQVQAVKPGGGWGLTVPAAPALLAFSATLPLHFRPPEGIKCQRSLTGGRTTR